VSAAAKRIAVVLFNLGGPDSPQAVRPFLRNLFSDPAIIALPWILRRPLGGFIARRRTPVAQAIYGHIGGRSPILEETQKQARALEAALAAPGQAVKAFVAMRYWHPFSDGAALAVKAFAPDHIVLLPLYPQFSTTTTGSSLKDWRRAARKAGLKVPTSEICCYPRAPGFAAAMAERIRAAFGEEGFGEAGPQGWRLLLSAHGLPKRIVEKGDPYQGQVEQSAQAIVAALAMPALEAQVCYQSRVGPLEWIGPATDAEIRRAGRDGKNLMVAPLAFVSEHSETLVELDIEYGRLARQCGVGQYRRAATVGTHPEFIAALAGLVRAALLGENDSQQEGSGARICPAGQTGCGHR
jgi:ferrochelatase